MHDTLLRGAGQHRLGRLQRRHGACLSPAAMASSTLRHLGLHGRVARDLFTSVRRLVLRAAFLAEDVFAISQSFMGREL